MKKDMEKYLKKTGLKPYQLADLAKVNRSIVYRYLNGQRDLMLGTAEKIRKVIGKAD
jgi:plasmid maintenance system antidote protein VapI